MWSTLYSQQRQHMDWCEALRGSQFSDAHDSFQIGCFVRTLCIKTSITSPTATQNNLKILKKILYTYNCIV